MFYVVKTSSYGWKDCHSQWNEREYVHVIGEFPTREAALTKFPELAKGDIVERNNKYDVFRKYLEELDEERTVLLEVLEGQRAPISYSREWTHGHSGNVYPQWDSRWEKKGAG